MIYNKPQDIKLRTLPSIGSLISSKQTTSFTPSEEKATTDNLTITNATASVQPTDTVRVNASQNDVDIILTDRYVPENADANVFDLTKMPLLEGIPILTLPGEEIPKAPEKQEAAEIIQFKDTASTNVTPVESSSDFEDLANNKTIDLSSIPVDSDIPMLELSDKPKKVAPPPFKEAEKHQKKERKELSQNTVSHGRRLKVASFFLMLYFGTIMAFIIPLRPTYSESEKRYLAAFPEFSIDALISGSYFDDISTWFSDTFPFRENLTEANTYVKSLYGIETVTVHGDVDMGDDIPDAPLVVPDEPITNPDAALPDAPEADTPEDSVDIEVQQLSAIIVAGDSAYEYYGYSEDCAIGFVSCVNKLDSLANPTGNVYTMIIPTSMDITLNDSVRAEITNTADQKAAIDLFNKSFKNCVPVDGIYAAERLHRNEYTYFRTDHHWTALGAYYAYEQFALEKGIAPIPLATYPVRSFTGFLGTFYASSGQNPALKENPDTVTAYMPFNNVECSIVPKTGDGSMSWPVINDVEDYGSSLKYLTFIGGDNALTTITNLDNPDGGVCIVIKDSYGNAFVPFLIPHYSTVYVIDPRHYDGSLSDFCSDKEIEDVIFLVNISCTRNYTYLDSLQDLTR